MYACVCVVCVRVGRWVGVDVCVGGWVGVDVCVGGWVHLHDNIPYQITFKVKLTYT